MSPPHTIGFDPSPSARHTLPDGKYFRKRLDSHLEWKGNPQGSAWPRKHSKALDLSFPPEYSHNLKTLVSGVYALNNLNILISGDELAPPTSYLIRWEVAVWLVTPTLQCF